MTDPNEQSSMDQENQQQLEDSNLPDGQVSGDGATDDSSPLEGTGQPLDPYSNPRLTGKSPREVDAYVNLLEDTAKEQNRRLSEQPVAPPTPEPEPEGDFFQDPRQVLRQEMDRMMAPIRQEIASMKAGDTAAEAWNEVAALFPDFATWRPYIDRLIQMQGITEITSGTLQSLYYTAKGYAASQGIEVGATQGGVNVPPSNQGGQQRPPPPPQNRPSSAPLPNQQKPAQVRELTENERRLAREWKMSPAEYIAMQELDDEDVVDYDKDAMREGRTVLP